MLCYSALLSKFQVGPAILRLNSMLAFVDEKMLYLNTDQEKDRTNFIDKDVRTYI